MTKQEFVALLREKLSGLPQNDIEERVIFYSEMIDDRIEDGMPEDEAIEAVGSIDDIASQIVAETPLTKIMSKRLRVRRKKNTWRAVFFAVSSVVWAPLLISALAVIFALWLCLWAVIISLWAADAALAAGCIGALASCIFIMTPDGAASVLIMLSVALMCAGLFIFLLFGCRALTRLSASLTKKILIGIKKLFIGKEDAK